jgi:large subunit ribosomal protein L21
MLNVATLDAEPGARVELSDVLMLTDGDQTTVGSPNIAGAVVVVEVIEHGKGRKVVNFKYKAKVRYRRKRGHRQGFTSLRVREIRVGGASRAAGTQRGAATSSAGDASEEAETHQAPEAQAPRRRRRAGESAEGAAQE